MDRQETFNQVRQLLLNGAICQACEETFEAGDNISVSKGGEIFHEGCFSSGVTTSSELAIEFTLE